MMDKMEKAVMTGTAMLIAAILLYTVQDIVATVKRNNEIARQVKQTNEIVCNIVEDIEGGKSPEDIGEVRDVWGKKIRIILKRGEIYDDLVVRSAGPDNIHHSSDDVVKTISNWKLIEASSKFVEGKAKGWTRGIKEGIFGSDEEKEK